MTWHIASGGTPVTAPTPPKRRILRNLRHAYGKQAEDTPWNRRGGLSRPAARVLVGPEARNLLRQSRLRTSHAQHRTWGLSGVWLVYL
jgi:hypothetical protein